MRPCTGASSSPRSRVSRLRRSFDAAQRRRIRADLEARPAGDRSPIRCPVCGGPLNETPVATPSGLPYVRSRAMLVCAACGAGAAFDVRAAERP